MFDIDMLCHILPLYFASWWSAGKNAKPTSPVADISTEKRFLIKVLVAHNQTGARNAAPSTCPRSVVANVGGCSVKYNRLDSGQDHKSVVQNVCQQDHTMCHYMSLSMTRKHVWTHIEIVSCSEGSLTAKKELD